MSATSSETGHWIPLMDYAMKNGVSLSTLRRHIKAGKLRHKSEHGKYYVLDDSFDDDFELSSGDELSLEARVANLEGDLKKAKQEIAELKMLVAIYEERLFNNLPSQI
jgi:predicted site-specific integrase-resolvase